MQPRTSISAIALATVVLSVFTFTVIGARQQGDKPVPIDADDMGGVVTSAK